MMILFLGRCVFVSLISTLLVVVDGYSIVKRNPIVPSFQSSFDYNNDQSKLVKLSSSSSSSANFLLHSNKRTHTIKQQQQQQQQSINTFLYSSRNNNDNYDDDDEDEIDLINGDANDDDNSDTELVYASNTDNEMYITESEQASRANDVIRTKLDNNSGTVVELQDEISNSFLQYALSIIMGRAIPDMRDGLKPVHRRILYAMDQLKLYPGMSHRKCARVVGEVLGKYHPHGDIAVYDSLVRMAQDFSSNYPVIDGHGNFGSIDADPAAAMRYTECRLTPLAQQTLLGDDYASTTSSTSTGYDTYPIVDFIPNFDGNEIEPTVLPAKLPFLLLNGASGIAVGMATNIPPHNLNELMDACMVLVSHRKVNTVLSDDELYDIIPGPDFPTGASILGTSNSRKLYSTGQGGITMRAITHVENNFGTKRTNTASSSTQQNSGTTTGGRNSIIVTELPYQVNKAALLQKIALLVNEKKLEGISDLRDESDRDGIRIVIELKRDAVASIVEKNLFLKTSLQTTFAGNFLALLSKDSDDLSSNTESLGPAVLAPQRFTLRKALECFLQFRFQTIRKRTRYQLLKVMTRIHIVNGLLTALTNIDTVIEIIRTAPDQSTARTTLMEQLKTSVEQTDAILKLQLGQLTRLNSGRLQLEKTDLQGREKQLNELLTVDNTVYDYMMEEFVDIKKKFGRKRRTIITPDSESSIAINDIDLIRNSRSVVVVTRGGYIKRLPLKTFESQRRGTRGKLGTTSSSSSSSSAGTVAVVDDDSTSTATATTTARRDEQVAHCFSCNDHDTLLMVTQTGIAYGIRAYQVPVAGRTARGQPIPSVLPSLTPSDVITTILPVSDFNKNDYLLLTTEHGWIKKTSLDTFERMTSRGLVVAKIDDGDRLRWCQKVRDGDDILIGTANGLAIRFAASTLRPTSRTSRGVRAINLKNTDTIADVNVISGEEDEEAGNGVVESSSSSSSSNNNNASQEEEFALIVTSKGYGKRVPTNRFRTQARGGVGVIATKFKGNSNDRISCLLVVKESDEILVITAKGIMLRQSVANISSQGRSATGVTIQKLDDGDEIVNVSIVPTYEETD